MAIQVYESEQTGTAEIVFQNSEKNLIVLSAKEKSTDEQKRKRLASYICKLLEWSKTENEQQNKGDKNAKQRTKTAELNLANAVQTAAT